MLRNINLERVVSFQNLSENIAKEAARILISCDE